MIRRAVALAALVLMAGTGTAQAKADDSKADCKHGGFVSYVDPATGQPFVDQGTCVSYVVHGGELVPVEPVVAPPSISVVNIGEAAPADVNPQVGDRYTFQLLFSGWEPNSSLTLVHKVSIGSIIDSVIGTEVVGIGSDGTLLYERDFTYCNYTTTITATDNHSPDTATVVVPKPAGCSVTVTP